jgi:hypothetical protein|tara:strand:+ start:316 stop:480 length:165 start_codon:yes stop_codon:yes gene_type:complete
LNGSLNRQSNTRALLFSKSHKFDSDLRESQETGEVGEDEAIEKYMSDMMTTGRK